MDKSKTFKWPGGKNEQIPILEKMYLKGCGGKKFDLYSPFVGSGAFEFYLADKGLVSGLFINDNNKELITTYKEIKQSPFQVIEQLKSWLSEKDLEKNYYIIRDANFELGDWYVASRFLFFRMTSYGGVYRTNKVGKYNVPFNKSLLSKDIKVVMDTFFKKIHYIHGILNKVYSEFYNLDFHKFVSQFKDTKNSFFYLDPPYLKLNGSSFISYGKEEFGIEEHKKLASLMREVDKPFVVSNSYCEDTLSIYKDVGKIYSFSTEQKLYKSQGGSGVVKEVMITNIQKE